MKITHKYPNLESFLVARKRENRRHGNIVTAWMGIWVSAFVVAVILDTRHPSKPTILIEGSRSAIPEARGDDKLWIKWMDAASLASDKWKHELPICANFPISLIADPGGCGPAAIACADNTKKIIYVSTDGTDVDRTTIMMHEIGHLLEVPHIQGDELMDAEYQGHPLDVPSKAAIAVANSHCLGPTFMVPSQVGGAR